VPYDPHDKYNHLPDGFRLDVVGLELTVNLKDSLRSFGFFSFTPTSMGLLAWIVRARGAA
jgi:hypothetical protein